LRKVRTTSPRPNNHFSTTINKFLKCHTGTPSTDPMTSHSLSVSASMMKSDEQAVGIMKLKPNSISPLVIVVGDPARATFVSTFLEEAECVGNNREYITYTGTYKGVKVSVASHGVGGGGASMAFEELINCGAKVIIRAGTCGSYLTQYREGSMFVVSGAVRRDGVTDNLIYREFPAVAHHQVISVLEEVVKANNIPFKTGICVTEGCFYDGPLGNLNSFWQKSNVCCVEMECSVLFVIASIRGIKSGAILNVDNYIFERVGENQNYQPHRAVVLEGNKKMCEMTLSAIIKLKDLI